MLDRAYIEITNVCNLNCRFCVKTKRPAKFMTVDDFKLYAGKLRKYTDCFCLHVMGEPLLHRDLFSILSVCDDLDARVILTTNGTLLKERGERLIGFRCLYKVQISLHSFESNENTIPGDYFGNCFDFAAKASAGGIITILRLWNKDGREEGERRLNDEVLARMKAYFPGFWSENKRGFCISPKLYLEYDERFIWPMKGGKVLSTRGGCRALRDQIAVLCDGTIVPCCLDHDGDMPLGNLRTDDPEAVFSSESVKEMMRGFMTKGEFFADLCRTCGYADRFRRT